MVTNRRPDGTKTQTNVKGGGGGGGIKLYPLPSLRNTQTSATHTCINCMSGGYLHPSQETLALTADFQTLSLPQSVSRWVPAVPSMLGEGAD